MCEGYGHLFLSVMASNLNYNHRCPSEEPLGVPCTQLLPCGKHFWTAALFVQGPHRFDTIVSALYTNPATGHLFKLCKLFDADSGLQDMYVQVNGACCLSAEVAYRWPTPAQCMLDLSLSQMFQECNAKCATEQLGKYTNTESACCSVYLLNTMVLYQRVGFNLRMDPI
jgi:hypothetical protein